MRGKTCVVTGASSGIGKEISLGLAARGAKVVLVGRDDSRIEAARRDIAGRVAGADTEALIADLSVQRGVRGAAEALLARHEKIHVLVNNAGLIFGERILTADGRESTFALNHLGYFLLTNLLLPRLRASAPARIVVVSSRAHLRGTIDFDNLEHHDDGYSPMAAYSQSKLANVLFTYELARRLEGSGVTVNACHPGVVATRFGDSGPPWMRIGIKLARPFFITPTQGADTPLWLATAPELDGVSGKYFEKRKPKTSSRESRDPAVAARLWELSARWTGLSAT